MSTIDLHIHSSVSDGRFSPAEVIHKAAEAGMAVISLADHDNVDGIAPALAAATNFPGLKVIPGVEISTDTSDGEVHILGYFIDYTDDELLTSLSVMRQSRQKRAQKMIARLAELGFPLEWSRVQELAGSGTIGRPHIVQAMLEKGYINSFQEAFTRYLAKGGPAYVERDKMRPEEAVGLILKAGGFPVLAHPLTTDQPESLIINLKKSGLTGLETYYKDYSDEQINELVRLADKYELITTGGTDYHGIDNAAEIAIGGTDVPPEAAGRLIAMDQQRMLQ